jgi:superfamily I DNA and RNA helicase
MDEPTNEVKRILIEQRLAQWRNTLYAAMVDAKVAARFADAKLPQAEQLIEQAQQQVKQCEIAIEVLQAELDALKGVQNA